MEKFDTANQNLLNQIVEDLGNLTQLVNGLLIDSPNMSTYVDRSSDNIFQFDASAKTSSNLIQDPIASTRKTKPPLPDPRLIRRIIRNRNRRSLYFDSGLFADPAWDILLDLAAARAEYKRESVTSACMASGVPLTTALRWIGEMVKAGLLERVEDETDRRRSFISLTDKASDALAAYFDELGNFAAKTI